MYLRFYVNEQHEASRQPLGIFHAVRYLRDEGKLSNSQQRAADAVFDWIFDHLPAPNKKALKNYPNAVSWFHVSAHEHIDWTRRLIPILSNHKIAVLTKRTKAPGKIIYRDAFQVFVAPQKRRTKRTTNR